MEKLLYDSLQDVEEALGRVEEDGVFGFVEEAVKRREASLCRALESMKTERGVVVVFDDEENATIYKTNKISSLFRAFHWQRMICKISGSGELEIVLHDFKTSRRFWLRELAPGVFPSAKKKALPSDTLPLGRKCREILD
jgi:hypothetical protein